VCGRKRERERERESGSKRMKGDRDREDDKYCAFSRDGFSYPTLYYMNRKAKPNIKKSF